MTPRVCESCKEACAAQCEDASSVGDFYAKRIRSLPSPSPGGDPGVMVEALERIGRTDLRRHMDASTELVCLACGRWESHCEKAVCVGAKAREALESWRRSSPERTAARTAREVALVAVTTEVWSAVKRWGGTARADALVDRVADALEADRRNRP